MFAMQRSVQAAFDKVRESASKYNDLQLAYEREAAKLEAPMNASKEKFAVIPEYIPRKFGSTTVGEPEDDEEDDYEVEAEKVDAAEELEEFDYSEFDDSGNTGLMCTLFGCGSDSNVRIRRQNSAAKSGGARSESLGPKYKKLKEKNKEMSMRLEELEAELRRKHTEAVITSMAEEDLTFSPKGDFRTSLLSHIEGNTQQELEVKLTLPASPAASSGVSPEASEKQVGDEVAATNHELPQEQILATKYDDDNSEFNEQKHD